MKIIHVITGLSAGGAETMLYRLLSRMGGLAAGAEVICLNDGGPMEAKIRDLGIRVRTLGMPRGGLSLSGLSELTRHLRAGKPDVVQTWMYHGDLIGGLAAKAAGCKAIVWNIRHSNLDPRVNKRHTLWTARLCGYLSGWIPSRIICNSEVSGRIHERFGYDKDRITIIPNGFDLAQFRPSPSARAEVREELGLSPGTVLVGLIARFHPQKDHGNFIAAAALIRASDPDVRFLLAGKDVDGDNSFLADAIAKAGLAGSMHLLGFRTDIPRLTAALDVACSSSCGEGFPNSIGEAMASGVPCVVTDVGDSGILVGETGRTVASRSPERLADALMDMIAMGPEEREALGRSARFRVMENFDLQAVTDRYVEVYESLCKRFVKGTA